MPNSDTIETGTHSVVAGHSGMRIIHIRSPMTPEYRFEYHPETGKVYVVRVGVKPEVGDVIAEHCDTHARGIGFVQTYLRGIEEGKLKLTKGIYRHGN
jgi:hypothetical protein